MDRDITDDRCVCKSGGCVSFLSLFSFLVSLSCVSSSVKFCVYKSTQAPNLADHMRYEILNPKSVARQ